MLIRNDRYNSTNTPKRTAHVPHNREILTKAIFAFTSKFAITTCTSGTGATKRATGDWNCIVVHQLLSPSGTKPQASRAAVQVRTPEKEHGIYRPSNDRLGHGRHVFLYRNAFCGRDRETIKAIKISLFMLMSTAEKKDFRGRTKRCRSASSVHSRIKMYRKFCSQYLKFMTQVKKYIRYLAIEHVEFVSIVFRRFCYR